MVFISQLQSLRGLRSAKGGHHSDTASTSSRRSQSKDGGDILGLDSLPHNAPRSGTGLKIEQRISPVGSQSAVWHFGEYASDLGRGSASEAMKLRRQQIPVI